jgi:hypothetical protein
MMQRQEKPGSPAEAVAMILVTFGAPELSEWAAKPMEQAVTDAQFALGGWIRDHWVYGDPCPLGKRIRELVCSIHEDEISALVLEALWWVLNDEDCPTVEGLLERRYGRLESPEADASVPSVDCIFPSSAAAALDAPYAVRFRSRIDIRVSLLV